jgi:hypothetical protein
MPFSEMKKPLVRATEIKLYVGRKENISTQTSSLRCIISHPHAAFLIADIEQCQM